MRKFFKIGMLASLGFFTLGLGLVIAAVALGATWAQFTDAVNAEEFSFGPRILKSSTAQKTDSLSYSDVDALDIHFGAGELELKETDDSQISVEVLEDPSHAIQTNLEDNTLTISAKSGSSRAKNLRVCVHIPKDQRFDEVTLRVGASLITVDSLQTDDLEVELGAGSFIGTGKITAEESNWEVGMGELDLNYLDCENLHMDCGMGSVTVTMAGRRENYDCDITCHAGAVTVGDSEFSMGKHHLESDDADREMEIQCGMGSVDLMFDGN